jgi:hypothetical protein
MSCALPGMPSSRPGNATAEIDPRDNRSLTMIGHDRAHGMVGIRRRAPNRDENPSKDADNRARPKANSLNSRKLLGSFGLAHHAGLVRLAQRLGFVRLRVDPFSRRLRRDRPEAQRPMGIIPHFRRPDHRDLNRSDVLLTCSGIGRAFDAQVPSCHRRPRGKHGAETIGAVNLSLTMAGHDRPHAMVGIRRRAGQG